MIYMWIFHSPSFIVQLSPYLRHAPPVRSLLQLFIPFDRAHNLFSSICYCYLIIIRFHLVSPPSTSHQSASILLVVLLPSSATRSIMPLSIPVQFFIHHRLLFPSSIPRLS